MKLKSVLITVTLFPLSFVTRDALAVETSGVGLGANEPRASLACLALYVNGCGRPVVARCDRREFRGAVATYLGSFGGQTCQVSVDLLGVGSVHSGGNGSGG
jgi:hypothetical protein